ncbi:MAG: hypothetical protein RL362_1282 [Bacteroidota bacterium]|jgi:uncharacterized HAD superfamily protein
MSITKTQVPISICLSPLPHLWLIDIDGTIVTHNGHLLNDENILPGVLDFWNAIPASDTIVLLTARSESFRDLTLSWLKKNNLRFDHVLFNLPNGERILINDKKESGLVTAHSVNLNRNSGFTNLEFKVIPGL